MAMMHDNREHRLWVDEDSLGSGVRASMGERLPRAAP